MDNLDVDSLFTDIPLDETIDICVNQLFENTNTDEGFAIYLTVYFTNKLMVYQWVHLLDLSLLTHFCHTMKKTG